MLSATDILEMQDIVRKVPVAPCVIRCAMKFARLTQGSRLRGRRRTAADAVQTAKTANMPDFVQDYLRGRAGQRRRSIDPGGQGPSGVRGRYYVAAARTVRVVAPPGSDRIVTNFNAESKGHQSRTTSFAS